MPLPGPLLGLEDVPRIRQRFPQIIPILANKWRTSRSTTVSTHQLDTSLNAGAWSTRGGVWPMTPLKQRGRWAMHMNHAGHILVYILYLSGTKAYVHTSFEPHRPRSETCREKQVHDTTHRCDATCVIIPPCRNPTVGVPSHSPAGPARQERRPDQTKQMSPGPSMTITASNSAGDWVQYLSGSSGIRSIRANLQVTIS